MTIIMALLLAAVAANGGDTSAQRIADAKTDDERACIVDDVGHTPALRDALWKEIERLRLAHALDKDPSPALFLERLGREQHDEKAIGLALNALGVVEENARHWPAAETLYQEAAARARACGDDRTLAVALLGLSFVHRSRGYADAVVPDLVEARAVAYRGSRDDIYPLVVNIHGTWKRVHGDLDEALADFSEARGIMEAKGDLESAAGITNNMGSVWRDLGDDTRAIQAYEQALAYAGKIKNDQLMAYAWNNLGSLYLLAGDYERARVAIERSLELKQKLGDPSAASSLVNLGEIARRRHRSEEAFRWYSRSLAVSVPRSDWTRIADAQCNIAELALDDGRPHVALDFATHAAVLSKLHNVVRAFVVATTTRGNALRLLGQPTAARAAFDEAIAAIEGERAHAGGPQPQRALFLEKRLDPYFSSVLLLRATHPAEALAYAEKTKARVLLDLLYGQPIDASSPMYLANDESAIEFVTAPHETVVFVIDRGGARVRSRRVALAGAALVREVEALRVSIARRDLSAGKKAASLFRRLFAGVWPLVSERRHLIIVPDGPLWELPFAALVTPDGRYLIEHATITLAPSLAARAAMRARAERHEAAPLEILVFGSAAARDGLPPLPEAEQQARAIAALYGDRGRVYVGPEATETRLKSEIAGARILHIAAHGALNDANPMYSHLLLGADARNDGSLNAREIVNLPLRSELTVLSACETGRGRTHQGEGVVGLAWAFFLAGSPSTVVSQWSVDASTTTSLMLAFHQRLRAGATKSGALREAALTLLRDPKSRHPFYWAPFVLIGDDAKLRVP